jgi:hypothetical protein
LLILRQNYQASTQRNYWKWPMTRFRFYDTWTSGKNQIMRKSWLWN